MSTSSQLLIVRLDHLRFALPLVAVDRVIRAVAITALPGAPDLVLGAIDVHGDLLPVLDVRQRFLLPRREIRSEDVFLLARTSRRTVALMLDEAEAVVERAHADLVPTADVVADVEAFPGIARLEDGLVLIHDLERFLSAPDERALDEALDETARR